MNGEEHRFVIYSLFKSDMALQTDMHNYVHNHLFQQSSVECFSIHGKWFVSGIFIDHIALKNIRGEQCEKQHVAYDFCCKKITFQI